MNIQKDIKCYCRICNSRANFNRDYWKKFFEELCKQKEIINV